MYIKEEIINLKGPEYYLRYKAVPNADIDVYLYDQVKDENIYRFEKVYALNNSVLSNQFGFDYTKSLLYFSLNYQKNACIRIIYYTEGSNNSYHTGGNLDTIVNNVLGWSENRVLDGLFVYWLDYEEGGTIKRIQAGSFVYQNKFYVYPGGVFDIRKEAPPNIKNTFRSYLLFINSEWLSSYMYPQNKMLNRIGIIHSSTTDGNLEVTLNDVNAKYESLYASIPLKIAYIHLYLMDNSDYEIWVDYPKESRIIS